MKKIQDLKLISEFIDEKQEKALNDFIDQQTWSKTLNRRTLQYGYEYNYLKSNETPKITKPIPDEFIPLIEKLIRNKIFTQQPDQIIVNEYEPGQGISAHIDQTVHFGETVASLSLKSATTMEMKNYNDTSPGCIKGEIINIRLQRRSLLVLQGKARYNWSHSIAKLKQDVVDGETIKRGKRISLTFRTMKGVKGVIGVKGVKEVSLTPKPQTEVKEIVEMNKPDELKSVNRDELKSVKRDEKKEKKRLVIAIIGSAGRGADADKMSFEIYNSMVETAVHTIQDIKKQFNLTNGNSEIILASGGSAWSDHLAVTLWQEGRGGFDGLEIYLPCHLIKGRSEGPGGSAAETTLYRFQDKSYNQCGATLNKLHSEFSTKMQFDSIKQIGDLWQGLDKRVKIFYSNKGFMARNAQVANCADYMIAFSWTKSVKKNGIETSVPVSVGTLHTWSLFKKPKIHIALPDGLVNIPKTLNLSLAVTGTGTGTNTGQKKMTDYFKPINATDRGSNLHDPPLELANDTTMGKTKNITGKRGHDQLSLLDDSSSISLNDSSSPPKRQKL